MNLKDMLTLFVAFREQVITRRTKFLLNKARDRAHILVALPLRRQYRRMIPRHPHLAGSRYSARHPDVARLAARSRAMISVITIPGTGWRPTHRAAVAGTGKAISSCAWRV